MAKRYYKVGERVWLKGLNVEGVIKGLDIPSLTAFVDFVSKTTGKTNQNVPFKFMDIDKLRKKKPASKKSSFTVDSIGNTITSGTMKANKQAHGLDYAFEQVKQFHSTFGHPVATVPTSMSFAEAMNRYKFMKEEIDEFLLASEGRDKHGNKLDEIQKIAAQADAMIDNIYFSLGVLVMIGVLPQPLMDIVQHANMSKLWADGKPHYDPVTNKILKPEGWKDPAPFLEAEVMRQKANAVLSNRK